MCDKNITDGQEWVGNESFQTEYKHTVTEQ